MASDWEDDGDLNSHGTARTPGYGLDRSRSNSPKEDNAETESRTSRKSGSRSASGSPDSQRSAHSNASNQTGSRRSRSRSINSDKGSQRSNSAASNRSKGGSSNSGSNKSRSNSRESNRSQGSGRSRSGSKESNRSSSRGSNKSRSRSGSSHSGSQRSRSGSRHSRSSRSGSARSRSNSQASNRSGSPASNRSGSPVSHRSRSKSAQSNRSKASKSRSRSRSAESGSGRSNASRKDDQNSSRHSSPGLQIDAESDEESKKIGDAKKKKHIIDSDSDSNEDKGEKEEPSAAALFGDADDISSEEEKEHEEQRRDSDDDVRRGSDSDNDVPRGEPEEEEKEPEPEPIPETRIDVEFPKISCDLGRDIHFVKLPNFLSVETRPFDQETYEDEIDEEETLDEEGRARLKLKVENTIRWREVIDNDGNIKKESNARFVRWSDGSLSLHLGSEIFDVYKQPLQGDHNHLFIRQGTGLQGQAVFRTKLSFRPHSTESFTHRKMTLSLADRSQKVSGIKILSQVGVDPDQDRKTLLKKEEEKLRQTVRATKPRKREGRAHQRESFREEEGSDEEGGISLNAIKNKYKSGAAVTKGGAIYSSDEEGSDFEARKRKTEKPKALQDSDTSDSE